MAVVGSMSLPDGLQANNLHERITIIIEQPRTGAKIEFSIPDIKHFLADLSKVSKAMKLGLFQPYTRIRFPDQATLDTMLIRGEGDGTQMLLELVDDASHPIRLSLVDPSQVHAREETTLTISQHGLEAVCWALDLMQNKPTAQSRLLDARRIKAFRRNGWIIGKSAKFEYPTIALSQPAAD